MELEGFAEKKADNLIVAINDSKNQSLARLVTALGIRGVGEVSAAELSKQFKNLDELRSATIDDLLKIDGVGPNIAQAIVDWFHTPANLEVLEKLMKAGVWPQVEATESEGDAVLAFDGLSFVLTGTLPGITRSEAKEFIERNGGRVVGSVSKNTSYLVLGENPGSKFNRANDLGVPVIDEAGLRQLAG